ncbi:hypothetical protein GYMLUDRAFT_876092 [Collybiopsis luxurians FD-317 M1]|nr:hypothetical protein GYMLUDRAFT_876092 [Collybiopsis luxurians FD-317 M1]
MADHVLLVYSQYTMDFREDKFLDLYPLPGLGMAEEDTILQRTHTGITSWSFNEVTCISSDIDTDCNTGTIWLTAIFNDRGLRAMCITLNADRNMTFHLAEDQCQYPDQYISHVLSYPYDSVLTVVPGSRARGVARTASLPGRPMLALYNLYREPNGNMAIDASCIWVPQLPLADSYTFDGFSGLLCIAASNQVDVLEFE